MHPHLPSYKDGILLLEFRQPEPGAAGGTRTRCFLNTNQAVSLLTFSRKVWRWRQESNLLHPAYETGVQPFELRQRGGPMGNRTPLCRETTGRPADER